LLSRRGALEMAAVYAILGAVVGEFAAAMRVSGL
jgi:hypothetical protein